MKRDMDLVREILLFLEDDNKEYYDGEDGTYMLINIEGYSKKEVDYHLTIMKDEEYLKGDLPFAEGKFITHSGVRISWKGHDFIDTFQSDTIWNKTKEQIVKKGLKISEIPIDILIEVGKGYIKNLF